MAADDKDGNYDVESAVFKVHDKKLMRVKFSITFNTVFNICMALYWCYVSSSKSRNSNEKSHFLELPWF